MEEKFQEFMQAYLTVAQLNSNYKEVRKKINATKSLEEQIKGETGENLGLVDESSPEIRQANAASKLEEYYCKKTAKYLRENLAAIVNSMPQDKVIAVTRDAVKHDDSELGRLFSDYSLYARFLAGPQKTQDGEIDERGYAEVQENVKKKLKDIIARRIEAEIGDAERAELWASFLAPFAEGNPKYLIDVMKKEIKRIEDETKQRTKDIGSYVLTALEKDEDILRYAMNLYVLSKEKEEE